MCYVTCFASQLLPHLHNRRQQFAGLLTLVCAIWHFLVLQNHKIERMWPEINQRVNYPIKTAIVELVEADAINTEDDLTKFCLSQLCIQLAELGINDVVKSWNAHRIPGMQKICEFHIAQTPLV